MKRQEAVEIYNTQHSRFRQTKEIQWKFNLATWALIALGINFSEKIKGKFENFQLLLFVSLFFLAHLVFAWRTQRALEADKIISKNILKQLSRNNEDSLNIEIDIDKLTSNIKIKNTGIWWMFFQMLSSGILLTVFYFLCR